MPSLYRMPYRTVCCTAVRSVYIHNTDGPTRLTTILACATEVAKTLPEVAR